MSDIEKLKQNEARLRAEHNRAEKAWQLARGKLEKALKKAEASRPWGIEDALTTYLYEPYRENDRGYHMLRALDPWLREHGMSFQGLHWPASNQRILQVYLERKWDDDMLAVAADTIEAVLPAIKPGALANYDYGKPVKATERDGWKALMINCGHLDAVLALREDGSWAIVENKFNYRILYETAVPTNRRDSRRKVLMEALRVVRERYGRRTHSECECEDDVYG